MADRPLRPAIRRSLGGPLPRQQADGPRAPPEAKKHFFHQSCDRWKIFSISTGFPVLSQSSGQVAHVILTRSPLNLPEQAPWIPFDLHVLSTPPAFILSQNQTLHQDFSRTEVPSKSESQMGDSNTHLTTTSTTGWSRCLLHTSFDERRVRLDPSIVARTGFWLSFFRFQGATTHTTEVGGVKYTISGLLRRTTVGSPQRQDAYLNSAVCLGANAPGRRLCGGTTTLSVRAAVRASSAKAV